MIHPRSSYLHVYTAGKLEDDMSQSASSEAVATDDSEAFRKSGLKDLLENGNRDEDIPTPTSPTGLKPKSLVEMIQQDFPRTPSPVYSKAPARPAPDPAQTQQQPKRRSSVAAQPGISMYYPDGDIQAGMQNLSVNDVCNRHSFRDILNVYIERRFWASWAYQKWTPTNEQQ